MDPAPPLILKCLHISDKTAIFIRHFRLTLKVIDTSVTLVILLLSWLFLVNGWDSDCPRNLNGVCGVGQIEFDGLAWT